LEYNRQHHQHISPIGRLLHIAVGVLQDNSLKKSVTWLLIEDWYG